MADSLQKIEEDATLEEQAREEDRLREELMESLAQSISGKFTERASRRSGKENQWLRGAQLYFGKLSIDAGSAKAETPFSGITYSDRPDINIVRSKCSIAIAQTVSMQFGNGDKNWDLWPAKTATMPEDQLAARRMSDTIEEQLDQTKYSLHSRKAMWDRVILGTGILKGPTSTGELVRSYAMVGDTGVWAPDLSVSYKPTICRVNPWFFYPDDSVDQYSDLSDCIEVHPMPALGLKKLMKHEGFRAGAIAEVLETKPQEYNSGNWADFAQLSENNPNLYKNKYLVLEYHGPITRTQLNALEIEPAYDSINDEYYGEVWVCQGQVIRLELSTIEASYSIPYYLSVWEKDPGSVFGYGVPLMMEDAQRVVNETWHMILDNSSMSSGPQVGMHKHLIEPANGIWELGPNQIWYLTDPTITIDQAIRFFNVPNVTQQLVPILQMAQGFSEEESQIPLITAGLQSPTPQDTATGQLVMQQASTTLLDFMSEEWDDCMTSPIISAYYAWNMQYNPDDDIKGIFSVDVRTSTQYKNKQLYVRDLEKLSVEAAQNPEMAKRVDMGALTQVRLDMMNIPNRTIMKTEEQMAADEQAAQNQPPASDVMKLQLDARRLDLEEAKLDFEMGQQQQREAWDHEEKMTANQARLVESQARVAVSQNEKETEMLKLAQRSEESAAKLMSGEKIARENMHTTAFLKGLEETRKQQELSLYDKELDLARDKGQGI